MMRFKGVDRGTHHDSFFQRAEKKELPQIVARMQASRQHLEQALQNNHRKLNGSFSEYLRS